MDNVTDIDPFRKRKEGKERAKQIDTLINQKAALLDEHMHGENPLEGQDERLAKIRAIDSQLEALG